MENPDLWLSRILAVANEITTFEYRFLKESYEKLLEAEYHFGEDFNFSDVQVDHVGLPPIKEDELLDVICIYEEYKRLVRHYWTT